jgi:hypothetical protein
MSADTNTGGPAFPSKQRIYRAGYSTNEFEPVEGMTLRDYFAAKALPAIYKDTTESARIDGWPDKWRDYVAEEAYDMADAMLKARKK